MKLTMVAVVLFMLFIIAPIHASAQCTVGELQAGIDEANADAQSAIDISRAYWYDVNSWVIYFTYLADGAEAIATPMEGAEAMLNAADYWYNVAYDCADSMGALNDPGVQMAFFTTGQNIYDAEQTYAADVQYVLNSITW